MNHIGQACLQTLKPVRKAAPILQHFKKDNDEIKRIQRHDIHHRNGRRPAADGLRWWRWWRRDPRQRFSLANVESGSDDIGIWCGEGQFCHLSTVPGHGDQCQPDAIPGVVQKGSFLGNTGDRITPI